MRTEERSVPGGRRRESGLPTDRASLCRVLWLAVLLTFLATGLAACDLSFLTPEAIPTSPAPTETPEPEPAETAEPGVTTLVFWELFALDRPQGLLLGEMVRDFEAENPELAIEIVAKSGYVGIDDAMQAEVPDGELPDLAVAFPSMIAGYAAEGVVIPLDAYMGHPDLGLTDEDLADIFPGYLEAGRFPGFGRQTLAFPFSENAIGLWVNDTLLRQAGWQRAPATWAEFEQVCFDVAATSGARCYPYIESVSTLNAWMASRGGQQLDAAGRRATFNDLAGIESLALLRRLIDAGLAWRPEEAFGDFVICGQYDDADNYWVFYFDYVFGSAMYLKLYAVSGGSEIINATSNNFIGSFQINTFYHIALQMDGSKIMFYLNGVWVSGTSDTSGCVDSDDIPDIAAPLIFGTNDAYSSDDFLGHMEEIRVSPGVVRWPPKLMFGGFYNFNFIPPTQTLEDIDTDYLYIGSPLKLDGITIYIVSPNSQASSLSGAVWSGRS